MIMKTPIAMSLLIALSALTVAASGNISPLDIEIRRLLSEQLERYSSAQALSSSWVGSGNGGYVIRTEVDLTGDGDPEVLVSSTVDMHKFSANWHVYSRDADGALRSYEGLYRAIVIWDRPGQDASGAFVVTDDLGWGEQGLRVTRFSNMRSTDEVLPHPAGTDENAGNAFDRGDIWPRRQLTVQGVKLCDYVSGRGEWKVMNFEKAAPYGEGYFLAAEDAEEMRANKVFTPEVALRALRSLPTPGPGAARSDSTRHESSFVGAYAGLWVGLGLLLAAVAVWIKMACTSRRNANRDCP